MDQEPHTVRVQSSQEGRLSPWIIVAAIAVFLGLAIVKPYSVGQTGSDTGRLAATGSLQPSAVAAIQVGPSLGPSTRIADPNAMACLASETEQLVILERWPGGEIRSWIATPDVIASGPSDHRLVPISVFSKVVIGVGICAPQAGVAASRPLGRRESLGATIVDIEAITGAADSPVAADLGVVNLITGEPGGPDEALLYGPPVVAQPASADRIALTPASGRPTDRPTVESPTANPSSPPDRAWWPVGSYAIGFVFASDGPSVSRWLRLDLIPGASEGN